MRYKVKENYEVLHAGEIGTFLAKDEKRVFLIFQNGNIQGYLFEEVELIEKERKTLSQERKEDAISTVDMLRFENSKNNPSKRIISLLLDEVDSDLLFIETDKTEPPARTLIQFNKGDTNNV